MPQNWSRCDGGVVAGKVCFCLAEQDLRQIIMPRGCGIDLLRAVPAVCCVELYTCLYRMVYEWFRCLLDLRLWLWDGWRVKQKSRAALDLAHKFCTGTLGNRCGPDGAHSA